MGNDNSRVGEYEERLRRKETELKDELRRRETESAQRQAQNERLERERMESNLKAERAAAQSRAESARMLMEQQRQDAEAKVEKEREQMRLAEERYEYERLHLQLEMEKQNCESEKQLTKKEDELQRSQLKADNMQKKMDCERAAYDQAITIKDGEVAEARNRAEVIRVEKDMMGENLTRKILEQTDYRLQEKKETEDKVTNLFHLWGKDKDAQHAREMHQQIEFRKEMSAEKEKQHHALMAANTQNMVFMQRLQNQASESQAKQLEMLTMGLQTMIGGGQPTAQIASGKSSVQTSTIAKPLVLCNPCIVFIDNFKQGEVLKSVQDDEDVLQDFFEDIQADVKPVLNGKFLTRSARQCEREDYSANDGIVVFVFSYGNNMTLQDDSRKVDIERIIESFIKNTSLVNKPKIFLVQAMQESGGEEYQEGKLHDGTNYLLCYCEMTEATYIENANEKEGSMFIKSLHDAFAANKNCNIEKILDIVESSITENINGDFSYRVENNLKAPVQLSIP